MPNNKDNPKGGSTGSKGNPSDREFEGQGKNKGFDRSEPGHEGDGSKKTTGSPGTMDDDDMTTSGGREGQFSEKDSGREGQWSPGSSQSSDQ